MNLFFSYPYFRWHVIFVVLPSFLLWFFNWQYLIKYKKTIFAISLLSLFWGLIFNFVASSVFRLWFYENNLGFYVFGLPLEEYVFLLLVPQELTALLLLIRKKIYYG